MIIIIINLFCQANNISVRSAYGSTEWKNFVIAFVFNIMQFEHMLQFFLNAVISTRYYQRELLSLPAIGHLPAQSQQ